MLVYVLCCVIHIFFEQYLYMLQLHLVILFSFLILSLTPILTSWFNVSSIANLIRISLCRMKCPVILIEIAFTLCGWIWWLTHFINCIAMPYILMIIARRKVNVNNTQFDITMSFLRTPLPSGNSRTTRGNYYKLDGTLIRWFTQRLDVNWWPSYSKCYNYKYSHDSVDDENIIYGSIVFSVIAPEHYPFVFN